MNDCISRQQAIELVKKYFEFIELNPDLIVDSIISLPSAQPERKTGRWIKGTNHGLGVYTLACDKCGYVDVSSSVTNFCPNCGAKMLKEGEEHETD